MPRPMERASRFERQDLRFDSSAWYELTLKALRWSAHSFKTDVVVDRHQWT